ncbi:MULTISPECIES: indole-3-glycerol-phosphate synthase [unclassified Streptomyces]|uniref:indole-3-glycerol-phosphate synthase n=1 Tax=unclassified Streptomyces TaxID=2593676 RepID=UPI002DDA1866|nr:indole-3-glycerol-phosphate synthase [Streptomyces sp. NBC_01750]WSA98206.1 indole-3-glycerol-phosphate synthase [Streptomyces sp. NBC_01794]WSD37257.1 indole-3-glycerol-phosphate synthase [Streptomyces sp. NBC_01750]
MSTFMKALLACPRPLVMEVKRQDADGRDLLAGRSVAETVERYEEAGAPCISVVTGRWFGGTEALLREVASRTELPLLRKDFITSRRHLDRSLELGAAAVLLTAKLLPAPTLARLAAHALSIGLTPFVEVADGAELAAAATAHPTESVIAVNNKDIATRERLPADPSRGLALLPAVRRTGTPCPVSASGISDPHEAAALLDAGFKALLIGTGLLATDSVTAWSDRLDKARSVRA